ncbi:MAG: haloalkane dehalogenase [Candidatus Binatia bacterium]
MTERDVPVLGSTIHVLEEGAGDPIVFLHGNPTSSYLWRNVMPRLAGEGRLLAPDLIGMGKSGKPEGDYRFPMHARYLDAWFEAMDLRKVTLVIHDWGSALGIAWARRHPDRVAAIAMMEAILTPIGWDDFPPDFVPLFQAFRTPGAGEQLVLEENKFIELVLPGAIVRKLTDEEMNAYRAPFLDPASRLPMLAWPRCLPIAGEPKDVIAVIDENAKWLATSGVPKLLFTAEPGVLVTAKTVEWCRSTFRNLEVVALGAGVHYVQEDHPEAIGDAVKAWRRRVLAS